MQQLTYLLSVCYRQTTWNQLLALKYNKHNNRLEYSNSPLHLSLGQVWASETWVPFRLSNSSSRFRLASNPSTSRNKSPCSVLVKISFNNPRQSIPKHSLFSSSLNNDRTSWMLLSFASAIAILQIAISRSISLSSSSTRIICSIKPLYSILVLSNFLTFPKRDHCLTPLSKSFRTWTRSTPKQLRSSSSLNSDSVSWMLSCLSDRGDNFPLHIKSNRSRTFCWSSLSLISKSKLLYSISDIVTTGKAPTRKVQAFGLLDHVIIRFLSSWATETFGC